MHACINAHVYAWLLTGTVCMVGFTAVVDASAPLCPRRQSQSDGHVPQGRLRALPAIHNADKCTGAVGV